MLCLEEYFLKEHMHANTHTQTLTVHCPYNYTDTEQAGSWQPTLSTEIWLLSQGTETKPLLESFPLSSSPTHSLFLTPAYLHPLPSISPAHLFLSASQQGKEGFLQILHRYMEVHGTVYYETQRPPEVPAFVKNHGLLPQNELQQLLRKAKAR